jgi:ABC-2 type transport system permease protein
MTNSSVSNERLRGPAWSGGARLVAHQLRYDLLLVLRDPQSRFFTIVLPLTFLILFTSLFGNHTSNLNGHLVKNSTYYVPGICTLGIIATSFVNLVITLTAQRETGVLKRRRSTPVPAWVLIASRTMTSAILAVALVAVIVVIGRIAYGVQIPASTLPAFLLTVVVGAATFCCLAFAAASFIRNDDSAQPIIQAIVLPLYFISGIFVPKDQLSSTLKDIASAFPVSHLNNALFKAFDPAATGSGIAGTHLLVVAAWGAAGLIIALWRFSWSPQST